MIVESQGYKRKEKFLSKAPSDCLRHRDKEGKGEKNGRSDQGWWLMGFDEKAERRWDKKRRERGGTKRRTE